MELPIKPLQTELDKPGSRGKDKELPREVGKMLTIHAEKVQKNSESPSPLLHRSLASKGFVSTEILQVFVFFDHAGGILFEKVLGVISHSLRSLPMVIQERNEVHYLIQLLDIRVQMLLVEPFVVLQARSGGSNERDNLSKLFAATEAAGAVFPSSRSLSMVSQDSKQQDIKDIPP